MKNILLSFLFFTAAFSCAAWTRVAAPTDKHLLCVSFGSPAVGYIGGTDSTLLKTTDGGRTWIKIATTGMKFMSGDADIIDINFINPLVGYAVISRREDPKYMGQVYKTADGGASWSESNVEMVGRRTFFFDENNGFVVGTGVFSGSFVSEMQAGVWQTPQYISKGEAYYFLEAVDFYNRDTGITGGAGGYVFRTFDGGASWDTVKTSVDEGINDLQYLDKNNIIAATRNADFPLMVSGDKGRTWTSVSLGSNRAR